MIYEWKKDSETFKYKTVYKIKTKIIDIEILEDDLTQLVVHGTLSLNGIMYKKFADLEGLTVEIAQAYILTKVMEEADILVLPVQEKLIELREVFRNIAETYLELRMNLSEREINYKSTIESRMQKKTNKA